MSSGRQKGRSASPAKPVSEPLWARLLEFHLKPVPHIAHLFVYATVTVIGVVAVLIGIVKGRVPAVTQGFTHSEPAPNKESPATLLATPLSQPGIVGGGRAAEEIITDDNRPVPGIAAVPARGKQRNFARINNLSLLAVDPPDFTRWHWIRSHQVISPFLPEYRFLWRRARLPLYQTKRHTPPSPRLKKDLEPLSQESSSASHGVCANDSQPIPWRVALPYSPAASVLLSDTRP